MIKTTFKTVFNKIASLFDKPIRAVLKAITNILPVKVIKDNNEIPFLYRYHIVSLWKDGPGLCIHNFVTTNSKCGFYSYPWANSVSFILCGKYDEQIFDSKSPTKYITKTRNPWTFNYLDGNKTFHRVMVEEEKDVWTFFMFGSRTKIWEMIPMDGKTVEDKKPMSQTVTDQDGCWWRTVGQATNYICQSKELTLCQEGKGAGLHEHIDHSGKVIATVDSIIIAKEESKILLIKRGKEPFKGMWAFPGGRIEQADLNMLSAAYRELKEKTKLTNVKLEYVKTVGNSSRDPRGRPKVTLCQKEGFCLTSLYLGVLPKIPDRGIRAGDCAAAVDYQWFDLKTLPLMAFDHREILDDILSTNACLIEG